MSNLLWLIPVLPLIGFLINGLFRLPKTVAAIVGCAGPIASFALSAAARSAGLRASVYLGSSAKLGRQLKWASDAGARWCLIYGEQEHEAGMVTVRDMRTGEQVQVPAADVASYLAGAGHGES